MRNGVASLASISIDCLDLAADDLVADVAAAIELGARQAEHQPAPEQWRVMLDPVGHLFCLSAARPD